MSYQDKLKEEARNKQIAHKALTIIYNLAAGDTHEDGNLTIHVTRGPRSDFNRNTTDYLGIRYRGRPVFSSQDDDVDSYSPGQSWEQELERIYQIALTKPRRY